MKNPRPACRIVVLLRRGRLVLAAWAALPCALLALPGFRLGPGWGLLLCGLAAALGLAAWAWGCSFAAAATGSTLRLYTGLFFLRERRIPQAAVCGCTQLATPLLRLAGCRMLLLYTPGRVHMLPVLARPDAEWLAAWAAGGAL